MQGFFLFNKPSGPSSAQFLNQVKHTLALSRETKIGHGGTLDPFAEGLLVVGVSRAYTKLLHQQLLHENKEYEAEIILGATSDTDDKTGKIERVEDKTGNAKSIVRQFARIGERYEWIKTAIEKIKQEEKQVPPNYSAIKLEGKPAYKRSRDGETLNLASKKVSLLEYMIEKTERQNDNISIQLTMLVSSGFYIRSFARDLGVELGVGGYVNTLKRTKIGDFSLKNALNLDDLAKTVYLYISEQNVPQSAHLKEYIYNTSKENNIPCEQEKEGIFKLKGELETLQNILTKLHTYANEYNLHIQDWFGK